MNLKRDKLQIIHDILQVVAERNGRIKPTHILYKANLSYKMLEEYLKELIVKGFMTEEAGKSGKSYALTEKGFAYLHSYKIIVEFNDSFGLN